MHFAFTFGRTDVFSEVEKAVDFGRFGATTGFPLSLKTAQTAAPRGYSMSGNGQDTCLSRPVLPQIPRIGPLILRIAGGN